MKARVYCQEYISKNAREKLVWIGELNIIPRIDDYLVIHEDWAAERVKEVVFLLYENTVRIEIGADINDEYKEVHDTNRFGK